MKVGLEKLGFFLFILATGYKDAKSRCSSSSIDPYLKGKPIALMWIIIIIPVAIIAGFNGVSILNMWYIEK